MKASKALQTYGLLFDELSDIYEAQIGKIINDAIKATLFFDWSEKHTEKIHSGTVQQVYTDTIRYKLAASVSSTPKTDDDTSGLD